MRRTSIALISLLAGAIAGCSSDHQQAAVQQPNSARSSTVPGAPPTLATHRGISTAASLPDRGDLLAYDRDTATVHRGGYILHPVQLSEARAFRAVAEGGMVIEGPDGKPIRLQYDRHVEHPDGSWSWIGHPAGSQGEAAVLTFGEKAVFGTIPYAHREPLQLTMAAGRTWLVESDPRVAGTSIGADASMAADFLAPPQAMTTATAPSASDSGRVSATAASISQAAPLATSANATAASNTVDIVLGYSSGFANVLGGQSQALTRLNFIVDVTNQAYADSAVSGRIRLVQAVQVNYADTSTNRDALFALSGLACTGMQTAGNLPDGGVECTSATVPAALQPLYEAREQYGADLVSLVRTYDLGQESCGLGWLLGGGQTEIDSADAAFGFSIVSDSSGTAAPGACRMDGLAHELGHNMGLQHDRDAAQGVDDSNEDGTLLDPEEFGRFPYSFGYRNDIENFYTVMSNRRGGQRAYRVFSNPRITTCGGFACGVVDQADNARTLEQTMPAVATFRALKVSLQGVWLRGDFNGDGKADLLWRNTATGANVLWRSADRALRQTLASVDPIWSIGGVGDFNGDHKADILWRNSDSGANVIWYSANRAFRKTLPTVPAAEWDVAAVADFNGDGKADIMWRNPGAGANTLWHSGDRSTRQALASVPGSDWAVAGASDFNGDHKADILWRRAISGTNVIWNSASRTSRQVLPSVPGSAWIVAQTGDFNGDGKGGILWRNNNDGENVLWPSANRSARQVLAPVRDTNWNIVAAGDFNGDAKVDIFWRQAISGANSIWNSANRSTRRAAASVPDLTWQVAG